MNKLLSILVILVLSSFLFAQNPVVVDQTGNDCQNYWYVGTWGSQITLDDAGKIHIAYCKTWCTTSDTGYQVMYANVTDGLKLEIPSQEPDKPIQPGLVYIGGGKNGTPVYLYYGVGNRMYGYGPAMHLQAMAKVSADGKTIEPLGIQQDKNYYHDPHYANPIAMEVDEVNGIAHCILSNPGGDAIGYWNFDGTNFGEIYQMYFVDAANSVPGKDVPGHLRRNATKGADLAISGDGQKVAVAGLHPFSNIDITIGTFGGEVWPENYKDGIDDGTFILLFDTTNSAKGTNIPNNDPKPYTDLQVAYDGDVLHLVYEATYMDVYVDTSNWIGKGLVDSWTNSYSAIAGDTMAVFYDGSEHPKPQLRHWNSTMPTLATTSTGHLLVAESAYPMAGEKYLWYNFGVADSGIATWGDYLNDGPISNFDLVVNKDAKEDEPKLVCVWEEMQGEVLPLVDAQWSFANPYYAYRQDIKVAVCKDGTSWSAPYNVTATPDKDETTVSAYNDVVDNTIHIMYYEDGFPGRDRILVFADDYTDKFHSYTGHQGFGLPIRKPDAEQVNVVYRSFDLAKMTGVNSNPVGIPQEFSLDQNYPNPFNPTTLIHFTAPTGKVALNIYNVLGQKVKTLMNQAVAAGSYDATWDGTDFSGNLVGNGVYFYKLETESGTKMRKMLLQK